MLKIIVTIICKDSFVLSGDKDSGIVIMNKKDDTQNLAGILDEGIIRGI